MTTLSDLQVAVKAPNRYAEGCAGLRRLRVTIKRKATSLAGSARRRLAN